MASIFVMQNLTQKYRTMSTRLMKKIRPGAPRLKRCPIIEKELGSGVSLLNVAQKINVSLSIAARFAQSHIWWTMRGKDRGVAK
jgi:hypothetical protein